MSVANPNPPGQSIPPSGVLPADAGYFQTSAFYEMKTKVTPESIQIVRAWMQDTPGKRDLLDERSGPTEYTDEEIALALLVAADNMNSVPPPGVAMVQPGHGAPRNFVLGFASIALIEISLPRRLANELSFSDSNVSVDDTKFEKALGYLDRLNARYMEQWRKFKMSMNINQVRTFVPSGYMLLDFLVAS